MERTGHHIQRVHSAVDVHSHNYALHTCSNVWLVSMHKRNPKKIQRSAKITVVSSVLHTVASTAHSLDHMIRDEAFLLAEEVGQG